MRKIIACIDGSVYGPSVCDHAGWAAARLRLPVELIHVVQRQYEGLAYADFSGGMGFGAQDRLIQELTVLDEQRNQVLMQRGTALLQDAEARLHHGGIAQVSLRCRHGSLVDAVSALEESAAVIVIGKRGEAADFDRLHLGSSVERLVRATHRPVLVAARAFRPIERVLVAYDGAASSRRAVEELCGNPLLAGLERHVVMVAGASPAAEGHLEWARERLIAANQPYTLERLPGEPEAVISDYVKSQQIHLLVMGAYGHSRIRQLIVGSTTTQMIRTCLIPVLLYR
ncbi:universal stress protein [Pedomonas mirosovicensis]|uniref:universal stress protein n=1 Tax=Pedomonas mirosovicensis TaxID=2908641 RepID=UPI00216797B3|nr:universal stress protein [Pedomonas mirosovicensis]MCH8685279.1 universal stress protein [Pedomonas mirosovicensis]